MVPTKFRTALPLGRRGKGETREEQLNWEILSWIHNYPLYLQFRAAEIFTSLKMFISHMYICILFSE